jgi:hypothetical protein
MAFIAAAIIGSNIVGGILQGNAAKSAANTQAAADQYAADLQNQQFQTINAQNEPWRQAGKNALSALTAGTANPADPNSLLHTFTTKDLTAGLAPNYDFLLKQGQDAINNSATVNSGLVGGNALKALQDYTQNTAQNAYQQAFNNYTANQSNIFNRLASIAGLGQTANQTVANSGATLAGNEGSALIAGGAANAAGQVGMANALSGSIGNASNMYMLNNLTGGKLFAGNTSAPQQQQSV